jgi:hypothetical protein
VPLLAALTAGLLTDSPPSLPQCLRLLFTVLAVAVAATGGLSAAALAGLCVCVCVCAACDCMHARRWFLLTCPCTRSLHSFVHSARSFFFSPFIFFPWPLFPPRRRVPPIRPLQRCPSPERGALPSLLAPALIPPPVRTMRPPLPPPIARRAKRQTSS